MLDLQRAAADTVAELMSRGGIDGVILIVTRNKDDMTASSMAAQNVSVDSMIAAIVQLLGKLRERALADVNKQKNITVSN